MIDVRHDSAGNRFRRYRIELLKGLIGKALLDKETCTILDIGGTYNFWHVWQSEIDWDRTSITCVNRDPHHLEEGKEDSLVRVIRGNACDLSHIADNEYDIAFSNSIIEHVGQ